MELPVAMDTCGIKIKQNAYVRKRFLKFYHIIDLLLNSNNIHFLDSFIFLSYIAVACG